MIIYVIVRGLDAMKSVKDGRHRNKRRPKRVNVLENISD